MIDKVLSFIAPHRCYGCQENSGILCPSCYYDIVEQDFSACAWCLRPSQDSNQCGLCANRLSTSGTWIVGERSEVLKRLVGNHKYESVREASGVLAQLLDERVALLPPETVVCAVPTINAHIRQRGFDHAAEIARALARKRNLKYYPLLKRRHQRAQHDLNRAARRIAAEDAFIMRTSEMSENVLLIDDILTTGATLEACVRILREAGGKQIFVGVIARQPLDELPSPLVK